MPLACKKCGTELPPSAKFCLECGEAVREPGPVPQTDTRPADYTPKHLAERIRATKDVLEGERKQVTVLFADVKG
jgi:hypothetical protein